jgi:hypothetical protein
MPEHNNEPTYPMFALCSCKVLETKNRVFMCVTMQPSDQLWNRPDQDF